MKLLLDAKTAIADAEMFAALPDYSCSVPTQAPVGKRWKRRRNYYDESEGWLLGSVEPDPDPEYVRITFRDLEVV